jgi:hypothetical protein
MIKLDRVKFSRYKRFIGVENHIGKYWQTAHTQSNFRETIKWAIIGYIEFGDLTFYN